MTQASISSFFKRKSDGAASEQSTPPKKARVDKPSAKTPEVVLSDRTRHWHIDDTSENSPPSAEKLANHQRFIDKLGDIQDRQQSRAVDAIPEEVEEEEEQEADSNNDEGDNATVSALSTKFSYGEVATTKGKSKKGEEKLTPLELQVIKIQEANPSAILLVEVGYKYRFFGPDARTASKILGIACFKSHSFLTASIPVHRLEVHINRLVKAGKKVGVVRQVETAALKAIGDNRNKTFERKLCEVYSKGTYLNSNEDENVGGWILALVEDPITSIQPSRVPEDIEKQDLHASNNASQANPGSAAAKRSAHRAVRISLVVIRAESGEVLHDCFEDGDLRSELEKRLLLLDIVEVIIIGNISSTSRKIVESHDRRVEEIVRNPVSESKSQVKDFYTSKYSEKEVTPVLSEILKLPDTVIECLAGQIRYMSEFSLDTIFTLTNFFQPFENKLRMHLPATTIASLELLCNSTDGSQYGSLFWLLNHTRTLSGRRLLRQWITRPLVSEIDLRNRQDAVAEIVDATGTSFAQLEKARTMIRKLPDLEKGLSKIYYGKASRPEVLQTLQAFFRISRTFDIRESFAFASPVLRDGLSSFSSIAEIVDGFLAEFNHAEAAKNDKYNMFKESNTLDSISDHKMGLLIIESDLRDHLKDICSTLKRKQLDYVTVAGIDYLIELKNDATKLVPRDWIKVSGTKYVSRFHTPAIIRFVAERDQRKELLAIECDAAYSDFLRRIAIHYDTFRWIVSSIAEMDVLMSFGIVSSTGDYCRPKFLSASSVASPTTIHAKDFRHPIIERLNTSAYIPNDCELSNATGSTRGLILSGPNMGGKSSLIKSLALITIMAHLGCYVPCESMALSVIDGIYVRMGASDNILSRQSTFMVELSETSEIISFATSKSLVILDELGRGTSTFDGLAIASSVLRHFLNLSCLVLFVTHYPSMAQLIEHRKEEGEEGAESLSDRGSSRGGGGGEQHDGTEVVKAWHMGYLNQNEEITFLYKLTPGMATRSYGLNVAKLAGLDPRIIESADSKSREFEWEMHRRRERNEVVQAFRALAGMECVDGDRLQALRERVANLATV